MTISFMRSTTIKGTHSALERTHCRIADEARRRQNKKIILSFITYIDLHGFHDDVSIYTTHY